jgi:hypothetical protein
VLGRALRVSLNEDDRERLEQEFRAALALEEPEESDGFEESMRVTRATKSGEGEACGGNESV